MDFRTESEKIAHVVSGGVYGVGFITTLGAIPLSFNSWVWFIIFLVSLVIALGAGWLFVATMKD